MKSLLEKFYFILVFGEITTAIPRLFGGGMNSDTAAGHKTNPILLLFNLLVVTLTFFFAYPHLPRIWNQLLKLKWIFLIYLWMLLSILWSVDKSVSFRFCAYAIVYLFSAAYFSFRYNIDRLLQMLLQCFLFEALLSVVGEFVLPAQESDDLAPGWTGIFLHKNVLGLCMMIAIVVILLQTKRWNLLRVGSLGLFVGLLFLSQSFTAILTTAMTVLLIFSRRVQGTKRAMLWISCTGIVLILILISDPIALLLGAGGKTSSFTGRDAVWEFALTGILKHPLLGYGYFAFWESSADTAAQALHWTPPHAHNGFLQVTLDLGAVGLMLLVCLLVHAFRSARRVRRFDVSGTSSWLLILLTMALVHNIVEADLMLVNPIWYLIILGVFWCLQLEEEERTLKMSRILAHSPNQATWVIG